MKCSETIVHKYSAYVFALFHVSENSFVTISKWTTLVKAQDLLIKV